MAWDFVAQKINLLKCIAKLCMNNTFCIVYSLLIISKSFLCKLKMAAKNSSLNMKEWEKCARATVERSDKRQGLRTDPLQGELSPSTSSLVCFPPWLAERYMALP